MRKEIDVTIDSAGRDFGKVFHLKEMPASQAEKWAVRAFLALAKANIEVPDDAATMGIAGIAMLGFKAFGQMDFKDAEPLLDEMFRCVRRIPDPQRPSITTPLVEDDIEEIATRLRLRKEVFNLHTDFFTAGSPST